MLSVAVPPPAQSTVTLVKGGSPGFEDGVADVVRIRSEDVAADGCATATASDDVVSMTESIADAVPSPVDDAFAESAVASGCVVGVTVDAGGLSPPPPPQALSSRPQASAAAAARPVNGR